MKKVLLLSYYWPPSGGPGVQRAVKLAKYLPEHGLEPVVVTVHPDKASYPLTDQSLNQEVPPQARVVRTGSFEPLALYRILGGKKGLPKPGFAGAEKPGLTEKLMRLIRGNFMIPDARKGWNSYALRACRKLITQEEFTAIITTSPPHSTQLAGFALQQEFGLPWIADLRDPWTDIYYNKELYRGKHAKRKDKRLECLVLENADAIVTVSNSLKSLFASKSDKIDPDKIHVIPNGYDPDDFVSSAYQSRENDAGSSFTIGYTGTLSEAYPVTAFIEAVQLFLREYPDADLRIRFTGQISQEVMQQFSLSGLGDRFTYDGYLSHVEAVRSMQASNVLLLVIPDVAHNSGILTGKLFEYLASHRPVLGFGPTNGDAAAIIRECQSGRMFDYTDSREAAAWLSALYRQLQAGRNLLAGNEHIERYSRRLHARQFSDLIETISSQGDI